MNNALAFLLLLPLAMPGCAHPEAVGASSSFVITSYESRPAEPAQDASGNVDRQPTDLAGRDIVSPHAPDQLMLDYRLATTEILELKAERDDLERQNRELEQSSAEKTRKIIELESRLRGQLPVSEPIVRPKQIVIVFTASWCGPCKQMQARNGAGDLRVGFQYVDVERARPSHIPESYWNTAMSVLKKEADIGNSNIPMATWTDSRGSLRWVVDSSLTTEQVYERIQRSENVPQRPAKATGAVAMGVVQ